jgi:membrane protease YdiL (CAAX protease family)
LISSLFNYLLGEELFFRGILLPKMNGVFGRWDWAMNGILFASYHVHKIEDVPVFLVSSIFIAYLNKKYRSFYPALLIHGVEFIPIIVMVMSVVLGLVGVTKPQT